MKYCYFSQWINAIINLCKSMLVFTNTVFVGEPEIWKYSAIFLERETCVYVLIKHLLRPYFVPNLFWGDQEYKTARISFIRALILTMRVPHCQYHHIEG